MNFAAKPLYDVIFKTIKSGGVTSRCCDVMPCGITTLWRDVITTGVGGNPQCNHKSTKVILDGSNAGMIHRVVNLRGLHEYGPCTPKLCERTWSDHSPVEDDVSRPLVIAIITLPFLILQSSCSFPQFLSAICETYSLLSAADADSRPNFHEDLRPY
jgi:hypothetical protein